MLVLKIKSNVEFLLQKQGLKNSSNLPGRSTSALELDFLMDVLIHMKLKKTKSNTLKDKINCL